MKRRTVWITAKEQSVFSSSKTSILLESNVEICKAAIVEIGKHSVAARQDLSGMSREQVLLHQSELLKAWRLI